jgi:baculoviral IAP repeat-containing protein 6
MSRKRQTSFEQKFLDGSYTDLIAWADDDPRRRDIMLCLRQIANNVSGLFSIYYTTDELNSDSAIKEFLVFVQVVPSMSVSYAIRFDSSKEFSTTVPHVRCVTLLGDGSHLYPRLLLPHSFSKFIDYGEVFLHLQQRLLLLTNGTSNSYVLTPPIIPGSLHWLIQDLAYATQFLTNYVFELVDGGVVTGIKSTRIAPKSGKGTGYSVSEGATKRDNSAQLKLTELFRAIRKEVDTTAFNSPLIEIINHLVQSLSAEEVLHATDYCSSLFDLTGALIPLQPEASQTASPFKFVKAFEDATFQQLSEFKSIFNKDFNLGKVTIPESFLNKSTGLAASSSSSSAASSSSSSGATAASASASAAPGRPSGLDAVEIVSTLDAFKAFSYPMSDSSGLSSDYVRRYRAELLTLTKTLTDYNIFIRSSERDITAFKFMIVGPPDTPYAYGCFVFDMKLPKDYPNSPPQVKLLTTGKGTVRFNPNLYNCGKVCLSLLGTWSGEPWNPRESNINQVVMSICYMIFIEHPYFNEPGYASQQGTPTGNAETFRYNTNIMTSTLRAAVLEHFKSPDSDFGDDVKAVIAANWPRAKQVYESWCNTGRGAGFAASIRSFIADIESAISPKTASTARKGKK